MAFKGAPPKGYSTPMNPPKVAAGSQICQKCHQMGHWMFECPNGEVYLSRPSRTQVLENPSLKKVSLVETTTEKDVEKSAKLRKLGAKLAALKSKNKRKREDTASSSESSSSDTDSTDSSDSSSSSSSSSEKKSKKKKKSSRK